ncbi:hypothetical protein GCM10022240_30710 [Microbacterium kribbense]|uniref:DUF4232 domain-containing protein n=1 Tax=Microbacterium kribbense TaxID=433645 RepID=A0ABP7GYA8_9MICO
MSTPRRRHSPAVYRRRRLGLLLVAAIVAAGVWLLIAQPWIGHGEPEPAAAQQPAAPVIPAVVASTAPTGPAAPTPGATDAATPGATTPATPGATTPATPGAMPDPAASAPPCSTNDVVVKAVTDKTSYASGQDPKLSIELTNTGANACTLNVGTAAQSFTITSGTDTWWRSTDCQSEPSDMVVLLNAGQKVSSAQPIVWDRTRSSVATCQAKNRPQAAGGGASYHLSVSIGGVQSIDDVIFQLY